MLLEHHIAVRYKRDHVIYDKVVSLEYWASIQKQAQAGLLVILEAWTLGKCISN